MCLQDYQLARAALLETHEVTASGLLVTRLLPQNRSRVGLVILGPNTSTLEVQIGAGAGNRTIGRFAPTTLWSERSITIFDLGVAIQGEIHIVAAAALVATILEYSLPVDPENLQRLAATGKW